MPSSISDVRIVMVTLTLGSPRNIRRIDSAPLAQSAEQLTLNQWVQGSSPWGRTTSSTPRTMPPHPGASSFRQPVYAATVRRETPQCTINTAMRDVLR